MSQKPGQMPPARRRAIPGLGAVPSAPPPPSPPVDTGQPHTEPASASADPITTPAPAAPPAGPAAAGAAQRPGPPRRRPATNYATTRLVNFRIPVDLHDRYRQLVRDTEQQDPRLRHPSLTELVIALLEEGPESVAEAAALIRRKRAAEHAEVASA